jgi:hypothetical protein
VAYLWVPPRRGSGLAPAAVVSREDTRAPEPIRSGQMQRTPSFADLVTIGTVEQSPIRVDIPGGRKPPRMRDVPALALNLEGRYVVAPTPTREQLAAALLDDDTDPGDDDPTPEQEPDEDEQDEDSDSADVMPPVLRASEQRAAGLRAARYGLVRLDGGVRWVGVDDDARIDTLPPAAVEEE